MGAYIMKSLNQNTRVEKGFASIKNVETGELEDRMPSFFLAETCKYVSDIFENVF